MTPKVLEHDQLTLSIQKQQRELELLDQEVKQKEDEYEKKDQTLTNLQKKLESVQRKLSQAYSTQRALQNAATRYFTAETFDESILYPVPNEAVEELLAPTVQLRHLWPCGGWRRTRNSQAFGNAF